MAGFRTRERRDDRNFQVVLDQFNAAFGVIASLADGPVNVPILKGLAQIAQQVVQAAQVGTGGPCTASHG